MSDDTLKLAQTLQRGDRLSMAELCQVAADYIDLHKRMERIAEKAGLGNPEAIHPESLLGRILALTKGTK